MSTQQALALPSPAPSNTVVINARCSLRSEADQRVIVVAGLPVHHYRAEDAVAEAMRWCSWWSLALRNKQKWLERLPARCAACAAINAAMRKAGWRRSAGRRVGVEDDDASQANVCAASTC